MWPSPASSPWTATTPRLPPLRIPPHRPPHSPPTPAPLPNWGLPFTWAPSPDCKHTNNLFHLLTSVLRPCTPWGCSTRHNTKLFFFAFCVLLKGGMSWKIEVSHKCTHTFSLGTNHEDRQPLCHFTRSQFVFPHRQIHGALVNVELLQLRL